MLGTRLFFIHDKKKDLEPTINDQHRVKKKKNLVSLNRHCTRLGLLFHAALCKGSIKLSSCFQNKWVMKDKRKMI